MGGCGASTEDRTGSRSAFARRTAQSEAAAVGSGTAVETDGGAAERPAGGDGGGRCGEVAEAAGGGGKVESLFAYGQTAKG